MLKKISKLICVLLSAIMMICSTGYVYAEGPTGEDTMPKIRIDPAIYYVDEAASAKAVITIRLSEASDEDVKVSYQTAGSTAKVNFDYLYAGGSLTIPKGETSGTIEIDILDDTLDENDERFLVTIYNAVEAIMGSPNTAQIFIIDDDDPPDIIISDASANEVDSGNTSNMMFSVSLSAESGRTVLLYYETSAETASTGSDYSHTSGTLTFSDGQVGPKYITVPVLGDNLSEPNETFKLNLTATNAKYASYSVTGTIIDNEQPAVSVSDASATENAEIMVFNLSLSKPLPFNASFGFRTIDGSALYGSDYIVQSDLVTFEAGEYGEKPIVIEINDDEIYEGTEYFDVELYYVSDPVIIGYIVKNTGTGTIYDNESIPKISVAAAARTEGDSGTDTAAFTVNVSHVSAQDIYVDYSTLNGSAEAGKDYIAAAGTLKIPAGHTSGVINVSINGDTVHEDDEYFSLVLANPEGAEIDPSGGSAVCVIFDNDPAPSVAFGQSEVTADEGDSGTTPMVFTVMLAEESEKTISIDYETEDGTAETADNDYTSMSGTLVLLRVKHPSR